MPHLFSFLFLFLFIGCSDNSQKKHLDEKKESQKKSERVVIIKSIDDIHKLFNDLNYTSATWQAGLGEIPRITLSSISEKWQKASRTLPVKEKKDIFFRIMAPMILMANEEIIKERKALLKEPLNSAKMLKIARHYRVIDKNATTLKQTQLQELIKRVDIVPVSLALAQAAEESGWGTSRFAVKGNALFGLWDFSGNGMVPAQQRKELGNYGLAHYDTPLDSVKGYMYNINIGHAYEKFRTKRAQMRNDGEKITGWELAKTLDKYSERGQAYIDGLHAMISYNKLQAADNAYLSNNPPICLKRQ